MSSSSNNERNMVTHPPKVETPTPPPSSSSRLEFHHTLVVFNIRNNISIVLDVETDSYDTCAKLFRVHFCSYWVLYHIVPSDNKPPPPLTDPTYDMWATLDATVLQWIYSIISVDLQTTIIEPGSTTLASRKRLANLF
ncbi:unnamed protein product [Lathyrus oleraceus]